MIEQLKHLVRDLRLHLGLSRPAHRPRSREQALAVQLSGRVTQDLAEWVAARGGWTFVRELLEREMSLEL